MYDVVALGSAVYDIFIFTDKKCTEIIRIKHPNENTEHIAYPMGAKILIDNACFDIGGGATNSATAFSRLGLKTACIARIGNDIYGKQILQCITNERIKYLGKPSNCHTDFSIILDSKGHDRTILTYKGASGYIPENGLKNLNAKWIYVSSLTGKSFEAAKRIIRNEKMKGAKIAFNPSTYLARKGAGFLKGILSNCDILVLNKEEAMLISRKETEKAMLKKLSQLGPDTVIITNGNEGAHAYHESSFYYAHPHKNTKVIETTGAGDAFASSFVAGLIKKKDITFALQLAITNAESVISHFGAHNKLLTMKEAEAIMKRRHVKVTRGKKNGKGKETSALV